MFLLVIMTNRYYENENISGTNLLLVPFGFKNFLGSNISGRNLLLVPFDFKNFLGSNISGRNLLLVPFGFVSKNKKKCFDIVYISVLMLYISVRLMSSNFYFFDIFFLTKKRVQTGVYRNDGLFLL